MPKIKVLETIHYGGYDIVYLAYRAAFKYANKHNFEILKPIREIYIKGLGMIFKRNTDNYITEILFPYERNGKDCL